MASVAYKSILQGFLEFGQMTHNSGLCELVQYYIEQLDETNESVDNNHTAVKKTYRNMHVDEDDG